ncbi:MAG: histidinol phosphate phosphatase, partial [Oxalobacteraceae bacterium]
MPAFPFDPAEALAFAAELADAARPIALRYFRTPLDVDSKADESPVTIADRTIEAEMRRMIEARYPEHGIYGEEFGVRAGNGLTWVLDPIDG